MPADRPAPMGARMVETLRRLARSPESTLAATGDYCSRMTLHRLHERGLIETTGPALAAEWQITEAGRQALAVHDGEGI